MLLFKDERRELSSGFFNSAAPQKGDGQPHPRAAGSAVHDVIIRMPQQEEGGNY